MSARRIATAIVGAEIGLAGLFGAFGVLHSNAVAYADTDGYDYSQQAFPCEEDEVLGYAPQFGPDRVGCIHIDDIRVAP
jgi:hypothetical protein